MLLQNERFPFLSVFALLLKMNLANFSSWFANTAVGNFFMTYLQMILYELGAELQQM